MDALSRYNWPGNIRELQNLMERAALLSTGPSLRVPLAEILSDASPGAAGGGNALEQAEREQIVRALRESNWVVGGAGGAAARLGLKRTSLAYKMRTLGTDFTLDEIELAVGIISGTVNSLDLFLYSDISDRYPDVKAGPDMLLERFRALGQMAPFGTDVPPIVVSSVSHPVLMASQSYWLLVTTSSDQTSAGWYQNNVSVTGLVGLSLDTSSLCCVRTDLQETFEILGTPRGRVTAPPTPEPSTLAMTGGGLLLTAASFLRRKKRLRQPRPHEAPDCTRFAASVWYMGSSSKPMKWRPV
jgi:hypothetical protein